MSAQPTSARRSPRQQRVEPGDYGAWYSEWDRAATAATDAAESSGAQRPSGLAATGYCELPNIGNSRISSFDTTSPIGGCKRLPGTTGPVPPGISAPAGCGVDLFRSIRPGPLPGYMFRPNGDDDRPRPTVLFPGGFDGTCEEMFKYGAHAALAQGWNAVTWDGPGQGGLLIEHGVTMRPGLRVGAHPGRRLGTRDCPTCPAMPGSCRPKLGGLPGAPRSQPGAPSQGPGCDPGQYDFTSRFSDMFSAEDWQRVRAPTRRWTQATGWVPHRCSEP